MIKIDLTSLCQMLSGLQMYVMTAKLLRLSQNIISITMICRRNPLEGTLQLEDCELLRKNYNKQ